MALMTGEQYEESLRKLNMKVYLLGEIVKNPVDNPIIRPSMNSVKLTYALAQDPQHEDLMTATSHLTGTEDQSVLPSAQEHRRSDQEGENAAPSGAKVRGMLPEVCRNGRDQRRGQCHLRDGSEAGHEIP